MTDDGRRTPEGRITVHEAARDSGYSSSHINKMIQTGDITDVVRNGDRNYLSSGIVGWLKSRKAGLDKLNDATVASHIPMAGVGIGGNPASQFTIGSQKKPPKDYTRPATRPPSGGSNFLGGWRVERPLSPVEAGAGMKKSG